MLVRQLGRRAAANAVIVSRDAIKGTYFFVRPQGNQFFLFKTNLLGKFGDRCWYKLVYNNVTSNGLYENLVLPAKPTDTPIDLAPVDGSNTE